MEYILFTVSLLIVFLSGIWVVKKFRTKYQPNRWFAGFLGPFVLIVPLVAFPNLPNLIWVILIVVFIWTNIYFFETSKEMLESGKIKTGFGRKSS
ncbi:hypothetical protein ACO1PF_05940 [Alkalibacterium sp. f15]|uniref:hypothetical protein n=1 Tax=Alkalibacterium sp. f15 TaxID=3414029 RepID=UPI003BF8F367